MVKRGKIQKAVTSTLAVMMLVSLVLAVFAFVMPTPVAAIGIFSIFWGEGSARGHSEHPPVE